MQYNSEGNLIINGPSYFKKIEEANKARRVVLTEEEIKFRQLENDESIPKIETKTKATDFRKLVTKKRNELKLSQNDLAKRCNVLAKDIKDIENGTIKPSNHLHQKLRKQLNL